MVNVSVTVAPLDQAADGTEEAWSLEEWRMHLMASTYVRAATA